MAAKKFKENDRVKRITSVGCYGTVKEVRHETTTTSAEAREKNVLIYVNWDNGTVSCFTPEGLDIAE